MITADNREFKFITNEDELSQNDVDEIINNLYKLFKTTFPSVPLR
jgi:hypothetical protein